LAASIQEGAVVVVVVVVVVEGSGLVVGVED
jgi:hypothetical protein